MIGNLNRYFGQVHYLCYKDSSKTVYKDDERIALDNGAPNGYVYLEGSLRFRSEPGCIGEQVVTRPLVFVGAYPQAQRDSLLNATISALGVSNINISAATMDRDAIGRAENLDISKFEGCELIRVEYEITDLEVYDPNCIVDICKC